MELHLSFLRLQGQANDFKIQYSSVVRLFLLPKVLFSNHILGNIIYVSSYQIRGIIILWSLNLILNNETLVICFLHEQSNQPHTFVVISLDPPIRKGQTMYPHIVMQVSISSVFLLYQFSLCKCVSLHLFFPPSLV